MQETDRLVSVTEAVTAWQLPNWHNAEDDLLGDIVGATRLVYVRTQLLAPCILQYLQILVMTRLLYKVSQNPV